MTHRTISDFQNEEKGNLVEWRVISNDYQKRQGNPCYFVYRMVEHPKRGVPISEFLQNDGRIDSTCAYGWFADWSEIGKAFILNHGLESGGGASAVYTPEHRAYLAMEKE